MGLRILWKLSQASYYVLFWNGTEHDGQREHGQF